MIDQKLKLKKNFTGIGRKDEIINRRVVEEERRTELRRLVAVGLRILELEAAVGFGRQLAVAGFRKLLEEGALEMAADICGRVVKVREELGNGPTVVGYCSELEMTGLVKKRVAVVDIEHLVEEVECKEEEAAMGLYEEGEGENERVAAVMAAEGSWGE